VPKYVEAVHPVPSRLESRAFGIDVGFFIAFFLRTRWSGSSAKDVAEGFAEFHQPPPRRQGWSLNTEPVVEARGEAVPGEQRVRPLGARVACWRISAPHLGTSDGLLSRAEIIARNQGHWISGIPCELELCLPGRTSITSKQRGVTGAESSHCTLSFLPQALERSRGSRPPLGAPDSARGPTRYPGKEGGLFN
jgi:hypothetical protein